MLRVQVIVLFLREHLLTERAAMAWEHVSLERLQWHVVKTCSAPLVLKLALLLQNLLLYFGEALLHFLLPLLSRKQRGALGTRCVMTARAIGPIPHIRRPKEATVHFFCDVDKINCSFEHSLF